MGRGENDVVYIRIDMHHQPPALIVSRSEINSSYYDDVFIYKNEVEDYHKAIKLALDMIFNMVPEAAGHHLKRLHELYNKMGDED